MMLTRQQITDSMADGNSFFHLYTHTGQFLYTCARPGNFADYVASFPRDFGISGTTPIDLSVSLLYYCPDVVKLAENQPGWMAGSITNAQQEADACAEYEAAHDYDSDKTAKDIIAARDRKDAITLAVHALSMLQPAPTGFPSSGSMTAAQILQEIAMAEHRNQRPGGYATDPDSGPLFSAVGIANWISEKLPPGWQVVLTIENGWAGVEVITPDGEPFDLDLGKADIGEQLLTAVNVAQSKDYAELTKNIDRLVNPAR